MLNKLFTDNDESPAFKLPNYNNHYYNMTTISNNKYRGIALLIQTKFSIVTILEYPIFLTNCTQIEIKMYKYIYHNIEMSYANLLTYLYYLIKYLHIVYFSNDLEYAIFALTREVVVNDQINCTCIECKLIMYKIWL